MAWRDGVTRAEVASRGNRVAAEAFGATRGGGQGGAPGQRGSPGVGIVAAGRPAAPLFWQPKEEEGK